MENKLTMLNWLVSKNGRDWFYIGTTTHAVTLLLVKQEVSKQCPYLKVEEVVPGTDKAFDVIKVIRNTFEETQERQRKEIAQEEIAMLDKMFYEGNDQTH